MTNEGSNFQIGDFSVFGFTRDPDKLKQLLIARLGITPATINFGATGQSFIYSSYGEIAESNEAVLLKLGYLRSSTKSPLNARQLLDQNFIGSKSIKMNNFSGNALVVSFSKNDPFFSAFATVMAIPQLYYYFTSDGIICSDTLRCLTRLIPNCIVNDEILPQHFLFRSLPGSHTYFRGVDRLLPGQWLNWSLENFEIKHVRDLCDLDNEAQMIRGDARALGLLHESLQDVVSEYVKKIEATGEGMANLFSGGVDSSLVQYYINATTSHLPTRTISYHIRVPAFEFEVEYARQASKIFQTQHTFVEITPQDYGDLLMRTIDTLAQPPNLETEPYMLAIAEFIHATNWPVRYFFTGHGADSIFGE
jgi:hypothetical protein